MKTLRFALAGLLALFAVSASAQQFPTVPAHTVIGRIGIVGDSGPAQAIPLDTLKALLPVSPPGVSTNVLSAKAGNYPIAPSDCSKTILVTSGPWTLTLPAVSGFDTACVVVVCNGNPNSNGQRGVRLSGFPNPLFARLYMQQCAKVGIENGAWAAMSVPGRFHPTFTPVLLVDNSGSDSNDGFVSNAAANALQTMATCFRILQTEYDLSGNIQPHCSPTAGAAITGSWSIIGPLVGASVINVTGNGGVATLRPTAGTGGFVLQLSDFAPYVISTNINWDCTGGTAGCVDISFHQQTGADINAGSVLTGNAAGHIGLSCDSMCKINIGAAPLIVAGTFSSAITLDQGSVANINSGITTAASTTIGGSLIVANHNSTFTFFGALTAGAGLSLGEVFTLRSNSVGCLDSNFSTSGVFGGTRQWSVLNNSFFSNVSSVAVPGGTVGINALATFANGVLANAGINSGGC